MIYGGFIVLLALFIVLLWLAYRLQRIRTPLRLTFAILCVVVAIGLLIPLWYFGLLTFLLVTGSSFGP